MDQDPQQHIHHATIRSVIDTINLDDSVNEILGLHGSADAYLLSRLLDARDQQLIVLCADQEQARRLDAELRFYSGDKSKIALLPHWELNPYDPLSPHPELEAQRLTALAELSAGRLNALVLPVRSAMQRLMPRQILSRTCLTLKIEEEYPRRELLQTLDCLGYRQVSLVEEKATYAIRGELLDLFPAAADEPVRIDFYGDFIEQIRPFDPVTQRSAKTTRQTLTLIPAREMILHGPFLETLSQKLKQRCAALSIPRRQREAIMEEMREGILSPGRHFLLPLNYPFLDDIFVYLDNPRFVLIDRPAIEQELDQFQRLITEGQGRMLDQGLLHVDRTELYLTPEELTRKLMVPGRIEIAQLDMVNLDQSKRYYFNCHGNSALKARPGEDQDGLEPLIETIAGARRNNQRLLLVCRRQSQARRLHELLAGHHLTLATDSDFSRLQPGRPALSLGELDSGFQLPDEKLIVVTEEEIFGHRSHRRKGTGRERVRQRLTSLAELKEGDFIVHVDHGIGRYLGLSHLQTGPVEGDFLHLQYAGSDKLYLPVERIEKVQKYLGGEGYTPKLDKMGGQGWEKARHKARAAVEELARQLLEIYAQRELRQGFAYSPPDQLYQEFEATFPYEETDDQLQAIEETLKDMQSAKPMDRLICGDVGYGKTEVALRAAVKAVFDGKQVAVLVPTTILARQHWESFRRRLSDFPVRVEMVSRLRSSIENRATLNAAKEGKVDILIGTHRLLQRDVRFNDLGLLIIDEEQRFGVGHKEKLKQLRAEIDILTLTATPIPRTLHMGLIGLRDLSVIETAPVDRLAIRTYVTRFDEELIRQAILRELNRGGQVYFVHNRVQTIDAMATQLSQLVPEAAIAVGHGQMPEKELEQIMLDFIDGRCNLLLASTIIENGLDIPKANTIIINRADYFGLSQLYQLRGRVGRSDRRAYAYLLIPGEAALTREARERLKVLQEMTELGAGFRVASHDLELRGAGDLLGKNQSGSIAAIGFELYTELLEETIERLRGREREERLDPEIRLGLSAFLPEKYLPDPNQRLQFYQRLAGADSHGEIYDLVEELQDRYGELPETGETLIETMKLRVQLKKLQVELLEYDGTRMILRFHPATRTSPELIRQLITEQPEIYRLGTDFRLSINIGRQNHENLLERVKTELQYFFTAPTAVQNPH